MKKLISMLFVAVVAFTGLAQAQTSGDAYFLGKWEVLVKETPNGNVTMPVRLKTREESFWGISQIWNLKLKRRWIPCL